MKKLNHLKYGLLIGFFLPLIMLIGYYFIAPVFVASFNYSFLHFLKLLLQQDVTSAVFYICLLPDILLFFLFIWKDLIQFARGMLAVTFIYVILVIILHFS